MSGCALDSIDLICGCLLVKGVLEPASSGSLMTTESGLDTKTQTHSPTPRPLHSLYAWGDSALNLGVGAVGVGVSWVGVGFRTSYIGGGSGNGLGGVGLKSTRQGCCPTGCGSLQ